MVDFPFNADRDYQSDAQFLTWNRGANVQLFRGLVFRALMSIFSPMILLERAQARWEAFHVGTQLLVRDAGPGCAIGELTFPTNLYNGLLLRAVAECYTAAFEHARGHDVEVTLVAHGPSAARFEARWT